MNTTLLFLHINYNLFSYRSCFDLCLFIILGSRGSPFGVVAGYGLAGQEVRIQVQAGAGFPPIQYLPGVLL